MKNSTSKLLAVLLVAIATTATIFGQVTVMTDTNGVLLEPKPFFSKNTNALVSALQEAGYSPAADTNGLLPRVGGEIPGTFALIRTNDGSGQIAFGGRMAPYTNDAFALVYGPGVLLAGPLGSFATDSLPGDEWFRIDDKDWTIYGGVTAPWFMAGTTNLLAEIASKQASSEALNALSTNGASGPLTLSATESPGTSNRVAATTGFVGKAIADAVAGLGSSYEPLNAGKYQATNAFLTQIASKNASGITNVDASTVFSSGIVPIARIATGTPTGSKFVRDDGTLQDLSGGGGGDAYLTNNQTFTGTNTFTSDVIVSNLVINGTLGLDSISADSLILANPIGVTAVGTNAENARSELGLTIDVDVQGYSALLRKLATNSWSDGDVPFYSSSTFEAAQSTSAGRALLAAASALAQWNILLPHAATNGNYSYTDWNGVTNKFPTLAQIAQLINGLAIGSNVITSVTAPLHLTNGVLSIDTSGLGGGSGGSGGYTYIATNGMGSFQSRASSTNWLIMSNTISSANAPSAKGKFIDGGWSLIASNYSGTVANFNHDVYVNGTLIFRDVYGYNSSAYPRTFIGNFWLIRESDTSATFVELGGNANGAGPAGFGDVGSTLVSITALATNVAVDWSTNVTLQIGYSCDTAVTTNTMTGILVTHSWLRTEKAASSGSITADGAAITNIVSSASISNEVSGGQSTLKIRDSGVTAGSYTNPTVTIGADGRITSAASGSAGGGASILSDTNWTAKGQLVQGDGTSAGVILQPGRFGDFLRFNGTNLVWVNRRTWWEVSLEALNSTTSGDFSANSGNGGTSVTGGYNAEANHPGVVGGTTGTTTTNGWTVLGTRNAGMQGGGGMHGFEMWVKTPSVLPSAEPYTLLVGLHDQQSVATALADAAGAFRLSTFGDVWQFITANNSSITTNSVTAAASASTWYHVAADVAHGGSNVLFYLNGSLVATNTANIPTSSARLYGLTAFLADDGGTTNQNQTILIDMMRAYGYR